MPERIFNAKGRVPFAAHAMDRDTGPEPPTFQSVINYRHGTMQMTKLNTRRNEQRFIHICRQGWYLRTREGLKGPFENRSNAQVFLDSIIEENRIIAYT